MVTTHELPDEAATARLGADLADRLRPGDTVLLTGTLGAGKSTLCRALIRTLAGIPTLEVPSPSYTLVQAYETPGGTVHHYDLWRLTDPAGLEELGFFDAASGIRLVEWAERAGPVPDAIAVDLTFAGTGRRARVWA